MMAYVLLHCGVIQAGEGVQQRPALYTPTAAVDDLLPHRYHGAVSAVSTHTSDQAGTCKHDVSQLLAPHDHVAFSAGRFSMISCPPNAGLKRFQLLVYVLSPLQVLLYGGILAWACTIAPLTESLATETVSTGGAYGWIVAINASVATWSTLILNVADLSRFCPTQKDQIIGQVRRQLRHPPMAACVDRNNRSRLLLLAVLLLHLSVMCYGVL